MKKIVMTTFLAAALAAGAADNDGMAWGLMMQLGHNMWREMPLCTNGMTEAQLDWYARDFNRTDQNVWDEVTAYAANARTFSCRYAFPRRTWRSGPSAWSPSSSRLARLRGRRRHRPLRNPAPCRTWITAGFPSGSRRTVAAFSAVCGCDVRGVPSRKVSASDE